MPLRLPLTVTASGRFAEVTTGTRPEIAQSVAVLVATRPGERRSVPAIGTPDPRGPGVDERVLRSVIELWEPRATGAAITVTHDGSAAQTVNIDIAEEST